MSLDDTMQTKVTQTQVAAILCPGEIKTQPSTVNGQTDSPISDVTNAGT